MNDEHTEEFIEEEPVELVRPVIDRDEKMYKCINRECRKELSLNDLDNVQGIKCPYCGGRVLIKLRPKQSKRVGCI
ncbi:MAG TPA: hypothetical protein PK718_00290 [Candidatus Methanofastidiosa archaeon]|nr:hypothetical protein [Candidatus Methanofastidiosa archaeon]